MSQRFEEWIDNWATFWTNYRAYVFSDDCPNRCPNDEWVVGSIISQNHPAALQRNHKISNAVHELPEEDAVSKLWEEIIINISSLVHSQTTTEKLGGILAIDHLLQVEGAVDSEPNLYRLYNYVKTLLPDPDVNVMLAASKTLGQIAKMGGPAFGDYFVDVEVQAAIELLQADKQEQGRYAGVLILKELARNRPAYFHAHVGFVLEKILVLLRDSRLAVRESAAELLAACLDVITQRERQTNSLFLLKILQATRMGLKVPQPEIIHGSLLTYRELLLHGGMFMQKHFSDVAEQVLSYKMHRDALVRKTVITLNPTLAVYDTATFSEHFLHKAMAHLLMQLEKPAERSVAFIAIGHVATAVGSDMKPFLESIMAYIKQSLLLRGTKNAPPEEPMLQCVGMLAAAVGPNLTTLLHNQLDLMFAYGLSESLRQALVAIVTHIPPLLKPIQGRLLDMLSYILSEQPYKPLGRPPSLLCGESGTAKDGVPVQVANPQDTPETLVLALTTLRTFDFSGHVLNEFVHDCALPYLESDFPDVRRAAALTCSGLFVQDPICYQDSDHSIEIISDVIDKLLAVAIADPDAKIRQTVLSSLHERFDKHLSQADRVHSLFVALNDEVFENRVAAVPLIGRLAMHNPAYAMPLLRKSLIQLLTELEYSSVTRNREECTRLLTLLVNATQRLIEPYSISILRVLLPKTNDPSPAVSANILMCLGELACVGGEDALPHVSDLMQILIPMLEGPSRQKRDAALHTLGQLCSSTGYVIQPLVEHPQLLQILERILKAESSQAVRREVVKVLGTLGALDPYRRKVKPDEEAAHSASDSNLVNHASGRIKSASTAIDDCYQTVAVNALLSVLQDQSLSSHHYRAIEAIMSIFRTQGLKRATFLPHIIPAFTTVARTSPSRIQEYHVEQLAILVGILGQHGVRNHATEIFKLVQDLWDSAPLQLPLLSLLEALGEALDLDIKPFIPMVLPLMLKVFEGGLNEPASSTQMKIFDVFLAFGSHIEEYLQIVIPPIVKTYERQDASSLLRKKAVRTIEGLTKRVNPADHTSKIIHSLVRTLNQPNNELRMAVLDALCALMVQIGPDFAIFHSTICKMMIRHRISHPRYESFSDKLLRGERLPWQETSSFGLSDGIAMATNLQTAAEATKLAVNQQHLKQAWDVSLVSTEEDWMVWIQKLSVEFMRESPSHALRACVSLVNVHTPLARELFNAAFVSCWGELYDQYQDDLVRSIEYAITSSTASSELVHQLLNLAEFMEREDEPLPIDNQTLGEYAMKFHAYAKALHYKELEFFSGSSPNIIDSLISINSKLQQHDAAWGTLCIARDQYDVSKHEEWYERLGRWQEALETYEKRAVENPGAPDIAIGRIACLHALGEWDRLAAQVEEIWSDSNVEHRREIAPMAAAAAWALNDWASMEDYIAMMRPDWADRPFYCATLAVHQNQFPKAMTQIAKARDLLSPELISLCGESYGRSYNTMVRAQMLSELEEIIDYKQYSDQPERQESMRKTWTKRLQECQPDVEVWQRILQVRALVLSPEDDPVMWIKFANLCRKSNRMLLAEKTINSLLCPERTPDERTSQYLKAPPMVIYAHLKCTWAKGEKEDTLNHLRDFSAKLSRDIQSRATIRAAGESEVHSKLEELSRLLARGYFKLGEWQFAVTEEWDSVRLVTYAAKHFLSKFAQRNIKDILQSYSLATHYDPGWYKAWHTWAMANYDVVGFLENQQYSRARDVPAEDLTVHIVSAVDGFFHSLSLGNVNALQDTLRLLTLWFKYGAQDDVSHAMSSGFADVEVGTWLEVIPQALIVGHELTRVAILWHELWHEGLEDASRLYFTNHDAMGMINCLKPLHDMLEAGPKTMREISFTQAFGRDLKVAREVCKRYAIFRQERDIEIAWEIYYMVFKKIEKQLPQLTKLDLQYVSPELFKAKNLDLAIPGTYQSGKPLIKICSFAPKLTVISSKQRPRKLSIKGSDGHEHQFALKGHEDMRQDERVMQLFGLVNSLLAIDTDCFKRRLHIHRLPVVPLAPNAGLQGWVKDSDTLHVLIQNYRESKRVLLSIEYRLMLQMAPDYENLSFLQKIEVFEYALETTTGQDLYRILWLKSINSEQWLERRATYTRSLAVNSMVGHILGLGDRHPSNIMLERHSAKVVHIDFGDCFEVAMHREVYPEKIPFRLTRMLTHAMEVSGIEGSFRITCEISMKVLRDNKESLMAVLEALVYDPLINWRLIQPGVPSARRSES
ncbi:Phosphatidylinositol 3-kinase tor1 [Trametes pubescens]|uniref:Serine/threonine-protein kinase TOR n=1 Tax=Trametes pubescens TaxID=154538 RepID=A0A1M2VBX7_TRAPU|nr:Phosphatidylinositol 3-kinase tor1 [Trametes pubescens]